ncbi:hypothetical protein [Ideonella sp.]|jgi:hypothetical protein|uniref:hypothetical protein n=1 Tax=Ideonella sp. TaxID=1929293 RepID=UPI0037BE42A3
MTKFLVFHQKALVGHSALEHGDPPMGVAFGQFVPAPDYEAIAAYCKGNHADQTELALSVQTEDGFIIPCVGVGVLDYTEDAGDFYAELNVLGIAHDVYARLFPGHVAAYDGQFGGIREAN